MGGGHPIFVVDAFTARPFGGNPAGVVFLDAPADATWMQQVAAEMKHSETAFLVPSGGTGFGLRWFTPTNEVDLCGSATLASAHACFESGRVPAGATITFATRSGELRARPDGAGITLDFPATPASPAAVTPGLSEALGLPVTEMWRGDFFALVEAPDAATVRALAPDLGALLGVDLSAVIVTARDDSGADIVSRVFLPRVGIDEDPATGAAHCVLAPHWCPQLGTETLRARQASVRGGEMLVRLLGDRVELTGTAVTVLAGQLLA